MSSQYRSMSPKSLQVGVVWKASSSSLLALWIVVSVGEWQEAEGLKAGKGQSKLR